MQKKIIALAVAGLASTAAFAQTNVTIYGSVDYGYAYRNESTTRGVSTNSAIDGGQSAGNRLGFKGTEDLGNGLKAVFLLEQGFFGDTGVAHDTTKTAFSRQAYVGLAGNFGTVIGGRLYTPHFSFVSAIDPFAAGTVGRYANVMGGVNGGDVVRVDNAVAYVSPSFGGLTVTGAYSNNMTGQESAVNNAKNTTVYALLARYTAGPVDAGVSMHRAAGGSVGSPVAAAETRTIDNITVAGTFDAKVVKIHALYGHNVVDQVAHPVGAASLSDIKIDNYLLGVTVPMGKVSLKGSYMLSDGNVAAGGNAQQFAVGADYALSKRTNLYSALSVIDNDGGDRFSQNTGLRRTSVVGDASNSGMTFQQGIQFGVRHQF